MGFGFGLISILGGIAALTRASEPERYLVAGVVMIGSGVLWLVCSSFHRFQLTQKQYAVLLSVLLLGLLLGLFNTFLGCGGECGGTGFCQWHLGYPGRWLRISNCMAGSTGTLWWWWIMKGAWNVDAPSFVADLVFWSGTGLIISFLWGRTQLRTAVLALKS